MSVYLRKPNKVHSRFHILRLKYTVPSSCLMTHKIFLQKNPSFCSISLFRFFFLRKTAYQETIYPVRVSIPSLKERMVLSFDTWLGTLPVPHFVLYFSRFAMKCPTVTARFFPCYTCSLFLRTFLTSRIQIE